MRSQQFEFNSGIELNYAFKKKRVQSGISAEAIFSTRAVASGRDSHAVTAVQAHTRPRSLIYAAYAR